MVLPIVHTEYSTVIEPCVVSRGGSEELKHHLQPNSSILFVSQYKMLYLQVSFLHGAKMLRVKTLRNVLVRDLKIVAETHCVIEWGVNLER